MSIYYTDQVIITPVTYDEHFRSSTDGTPFAVEAHVEKDDKIHYDNTGMPVKPARLIVVPVGTDIAEGYKIRISKKSGVSITDTDRVVRSAELIGAFRPSHIEVIS